METVEIKHRQSTPYGCALYAVANCCQSFDNFVTEKRLNESKIGTTATDLSFYLREDGFSHSVEPIYYDTYAPPLPNHIVNMVSNGDDKHFLILFLSVQENEDSKTHMVSAYLDNEGNLDVFDSLRKHPFSTTFNNITQHYDKIYGIYALFDKESNNYIYLKVE